MNRRKFLERLGIGTVVAVAAPLAITEALKEGKQQEVIKKYNYETQYLEPEGNIKWVKHDHGYQWYYEDELENMRLHEERIERLLLQHGNQSLSQFLHKMGSSV